MGVMAHHSPKQIPKGASPEPPSPNFEIHLLLRPYLHPAQLKGRAGESFRTMLIYLTIDGDVGQAPN